MFAWVFCVFVCFCFFSPFPHSVQSIIGMDTSINMRKHNMHMTGLQHGTAVIGRSCAFGRREILRRVVLPGGGWPEPGRKWWESGRLFRMEEPSKQSRCAGAPQEGCGADWVSGELRHQNIDNRYWPGWAHIGASGFEVMIFVYIFKISGQPLCRPPSASVSLKKKKKKVKLEIFFSL